MKRLREWIVIPTTLALILTGAGAARSDAPVLELSSKLPNDPVVLSGASGGQTSSNCGYISQTPNQVVRITADRIDYLRLSIQSSGEPTLLVDGPGGRFCVLADSASGDKPEISGVWPQGVYNVYVGDRAGGTHPYTLSITGQNK
ncbi:hypothetical protein [Coleofasciculus sp. FACHB-1120]|uniref:hypothetical protein n=1 Tax=Coleofasciculus sp. FACHB-1120 TaxID=2692783 RepID=UPI0016840236|nr:hypothetical protein [Coleofasciculus sp. FACHB-1120]MBD2744576.1 hypothetical protein [Coleofasciculus sp. FACHB-1120]